MPYFRVCVHDGADPSCGVTPVTSEGVVPADCTAINNPATNSQNGSAQRWVEVRALYRFSLILPVPFNPFHDIWLQKSRMFADQLLLRDRDDERMRRLIVRPRSRGQALVEFALVFPILAMVIFGILVYGLYAFYGQQLENAAREAARYAAIHSSTAQCPTVSRVDQQVDKPQGWFRCDSPELGWPEMTTALRSRSGECRPARYRSPRVGPGYIDPNNNYDALPQARMIFADCTINRIDPKTNADAIACPAPATIASAFAAPAQKADGDDKASSIAVAVGNNTHYPTTVTVYSCFNWRPPMSGFLLMPSQITLRAVITECAAASTVRSMMRAHGIRST